jgi:hypothetical protein
MCAGGSSETILVDAICSASIVDILIATCQAETITATLIDVLTATVNDEKLTASITDSLEVEIE